MAQKRIYELNIYSQLNPGDIGYIDPATIYLPVDLSTWTEPKRIVLSDFVVFTITKSLIDDLQVDAGTLQTHAASYFATATQATGSVTQHSDVSNAGSGQIITSAERTKVNNSITQTDGDGRYLQLTDKDLKKAWITLGTTGAVTWDMSTGYNASMTIAGNVTLSITNSADGDYGTLYVVCSGTSRTITITSGYFPGGTTIYSTTASATGIDVLSFVRKGSTFFFSGSTSYILPV